MKTGLSVLAGAGLIFAAAACDFSPSSPFEGFDEEQSQGATLHGQIQQSGVAAVSQQSVALGFSAQRSLATASNELTVTEVEVWADGILIGNVVVDEEDGSFTIRGLPESFSLYFLDEHGDRISEVPMDFEGVKPNQEIDIVVAVEKDGTVTVVEETRTGINHEGSAGIELDGTAKVLSGSQVTGSLVVNGYTVLTRAGETSIRKGQASLTLDKIRGKQVHVRGVFEPEGSNIVFAFEIKLQEEEEEEEEGEGEGKVTLCHIPKGNPSNARTITVGASAVPAHLAHGDYLGACR